MGEQKEKNQEQSRVTVTIMDQKYVIKGGESPKYLEKVANYVDRKMHEVSRNNSKLQPLKVAVLAALNIADELNKLQEDYDDLIRLIEEEKKS